MSISRQLFAVSAACALSGCANLDSIYRPIEVGGAATTAVAIDIKQRAIFSVLRSDKGVAVVPPGGSAVGGSADGPYNVICAEPSPDALSAYSASGGITAAVKAAAASSADSGADGKLQAAFAAGEAAASVGLRTQSIQLLRDGLFSNCLAYMNKAVGPSDFYELQRRSQNFTLGLLAIEQLTGAVKAQQAALGTTSSAATGSDNVEKETAAVDLATKARDDAKTDQAKAQGALKDAVAARDGSKTKLDTAKAAQALPANAADPAKAAAKEAVDTAVSDLAAKQKEVDARQIDADAADRTLRSSDARLAAAQGILDDARRQVRASATGSAQLAATGGSAAAVTDKVASAVQAIVKNVLAASSRGESCFFLLESLLRDKELANDPGYGATVRLACNDAETKAIASTIKRVAPANEANFLKNVAPK